MRINILKIEINAYKSGNSLIFWSYSDLWKARILKWIGIAHITTAKGKWTVNRDLYKQFVKNN